MRVCRPLIALASVKLHQRLHRFGARLIRAPSPSFAPALLHKCSIQLADWRVRDSAQRKVAAVLLGRAWTEDAALLLVDGDVVDACLATAHQPVLVEFP
jgi:hypothetical protein